MVAAAFEGKSSVDRQRMVYKAIWMELQVRAGEQRLSNSRPGADSALFAAQEGPVHAVDSMSTKTPTEAGR